jgi:DNA-cytosine methyltransferase
MSNPQIDLIDLFSGYGGFSLGFQQAGFDIQNHYYSEIDPHAIACYKHNFPHAKYLGSVTEQSGWKFQTERPLVITFGSPCQDFSLAGGRAGLGGSKSSLIEHALLLIERLQPDFFIWENVKGVFSSNAGADFWAIIQAFADLGPYRLEWELVNSSWWVPQNRERVYVVGTKGSYPIRDIFPINPKRLPNGYEFDKVYQLSERLTNDIRVLSQRQEGSLWAKEAMQEMLQTLRCELSSKESREIEPETQGIRFEPEGDIQEAKITGESKAESGAEVFVSAQGFDTTGEFCEVVSIPTEDMLLLWNNGGATSIYTGCLQQQNEENVNRQDELNEALRRGEFSPSLLAVQSYKGKLFYSFGDGRNWTVIYIKKVEQCKTTLSSILEEEVSERYFLSEKALQGLTKGQQSPQLLERLPQGDTQGDTTVG